MSPRPRGRIQPCGREHARQRLRDAQAFLAVADLVADDRDEMATPSVTASLAVLAGIAAVDAACCAVLGMRARGEDHQQAVDLVRTITPDGAEIARDLGRLLAVKDDAQYGMLGLSRARATSSQAQARRLVQAADDHIRRGG